MKEAFQFIGLLTGFLVASFMVALSLFFLLSDDNVLKLIMILGLLGWAGFLVLFLEHRINKWLIVSLLLCGISATLIFFIYVTPIPPMAVLKNLFILLLLLWPSIVATLNITRIINAHSTQ